MTGRASVLRHAVIEMADRYAASSRMWAFAVVDRNDTARQHHERACTRRLMALQRLTTALANLSGGA